MRKIFFCIFAVLAWQTLAWGGITETWTKLSPNERLLKFECVADSDGAFPVRTSVHQAVGRIYMVVISSGTPAPSDFTVSLTDSNGLKVIDQAVTGGSSIQTLPTRCGITGAVPIRNGADFFRFACPLTLEITGNATPGARVNVLVYLAQ
ncbi:MAG: hypothetical protein JRH00_04235 [Deltaproteobacteria bacterium]|nr:hypothetical protein [Deltaproteobacteria bacterium]